MLMIIMYNFCYFTLYICSLNIFGTQNLYIILRKLKLQFVLTRRTMMIGFHNPPSFLEAIKCSRRSLKRWRNESHVELCNSQHWQLGSVITGSFVVIGCDVNIFLVGTTFVSICFEKPNTEFLEYKLDTGDLVVKW